jgi:hypothetical protein
MFWRDMIRRVQSGWSRAEHPRSTRSMAISGPQHAHRIKRVEWARENSRGL